MEHLEIIINNIIIGFVATAVWAPIIIWLLYKFNLVIQHRLMRDKSNEEFFKIHGHKTGTPRSGGLMVTIPIFFIVLLTFPTSDLKNVFLFGWAIFLAYGMADDLLVSGRKVSERFRKFQETFWWRIGKMILLIAMSYLSISLISQHLDISSLKVIGDFVIELNPITNLILALGMFAALFGYEITDGADGLVTGQFLITITTLLLISIITGSNESMIYLSTIIGSLIVYLYFNIKPARIFMGGTATLSITFSLILFTAVNNVLLPFIIVSTLAWVELFSSASQVIAIRFFNKKLFKIAPIHHHFEAIGWLETKVVQRFWLFSAVMMIISLWVFLNI